MKTPPYNRYNTLVSILGKKYIREEIESPFDFISLAAKGVNANVIINFRDYFNIPRDTMADMLNISEPTIYRWVRENKKLDRNYSVQLFELADLFLYGREIFSSQENFFKWLNFPNIALGGLPPLELLEIPNGIAKVRDLLGRIEYGVYS
jgi:putative toxin-antitoxin system antitoxin component (TIGR02293 family)